MKINTKTIVIISLSALFAYSVVASVISYVGGPGQFAKLLSDKGEYAPHYTAKEPKPLRNLTESENISAQNGGEIKLLDPQTGAAISLHVPKNALAKDTTISVTPLSEVPLENYLYANLGNGILVEPAGLKFQKPAVLVFDFAPSDFKGFGQKAPADNAFRLIDFAYAAENCDPFATSTFFVCESAGGILTINNGTGRFSFAASGVSGGGTAISGAMNESGAFVPDNVDPDEAGKVAQDNYRADNEKNNNSGSQNNNTPATPPRNNFALDKCGLIMGQSDKPRCSPETRRALIRSMELNELVSGNYAQRNRDMEGIYADCNEAELISLEKKCCTNRMELRRRDIMEYMGALQSFGSNSNDAYNEQNTAFLKRANDVLQTCQAEYKISAAVGGVIGESLNAKVCGYVDDPWTGSHSASFADGIQTYNGAYNFQLPSHGGPPDVQINGTLYTGYSAPLPANFAGKFGFFNDVDTVSLQLWNQGLTETKINKTSDSCVAPSF